MGWSHGFTVEASSESGYERPFSSSGVEAWQYHNKTVHIAYL